MTTEYSAAARTYTITASQSTPGTPGQAQKGAVPIPLAVGLLQRDGTELSLTLQVGPAYVQQIRCLVFRASTMFCRAAMQMQAARDAAPSKRPESAAFFFLQGDKGDEAAMTRVLLVTEAKQSFTFTEVPEQPVPSLLRNFSAPVKLQARHAASDSSTSCHALECCVGWQ